MQNHISFFANLDVSGNDDKNLMKQCVIKQQRYIWPSPVSTAHVNMLPGGSFKNAFELLQSKISYIHFHLCIRYASFNVWVKKTVWNSKRYLCNSTQNILSIHWKIRFCTVLKFWELLDLRAHTFFETPPYCYCFGSGWRLDMETFSASLVPVRGNHRPPVDFPHTGSLMWDLMFLCS